MPKFELQKVAFVNPNDLTETVVLSTILEGAGGATRSFVEEEAESYVIEDNQEIKDSQVYTFTMAGKPTADLAQLTTWADNGTKLSISGYAYNEGILVDNAIITRLQDSSERLNWKITAKKAGPIGYDPDTGRLNTEFMMSKNLLNMYYWQEGVTSGVAAGWDDDTDGVFSFTSGEQTIDFTGGASGLSVMSREIYFPFEKQVTFFANVSAVTGDPLISIYEYDENDSSSINTFDIFSTTGIKSVSATLDPTTVKVQVRITCADGELVTFSNPGLSIGTSTNYISQ